MLLTQFISSYSVYIDAGLIGTFGGLANYFYYIDKQHLKFKFRHLFTTSILAFFMGIVGYVFLPTGPNKLGYLMLVGFFCYPIIDFLSKNLDRVLKAIIKRGTFGD